MWRRHLHFAVLMFLAFGLVVGSFGSASLAQMDDATPASTPEAPDVEVSTPEVTDPPDEDISTPEVTDPPAEDVSTPEAPDVDDATPDVTEDVSPDATPDLEGMATPIVGEVATPEAAVSEGEVVDLDVMFVGAHPDDEAGGLAVYGQWNEFHDVQTGVITVTRGEGGSNAIGLEEGAELGILREGEERDGVGMANVEHVYNLDKVDFYYTVSSPLTEEIWDYDDTLERVVRTIRATQPELIVTMNPAPTPGNHGHHQLAARFAVDAYYQAADPDVFPEQITEEGLEPWAPSKLFRMGAFGEGTTGADCATTFDADEPTDVIYGVWEGIESEENPGMTWAQIEREGQRAHASQGWATFPDVPTDPDEIGCDYLTQFDSRVPFDADNTDPTAALENAVLAGDSGWETGDHFYLTTDTFAIAPGETFELTTNVHGDDVTTDAMVTPALPEGWVVIETGDAVTEDDGSWTRTLTVEVAADADVNTRYTVGASLMTDEAEVETSRVVQVVPPVQGNVERLPQVEQFNEWAEDVGVPQLSGGVKPLQSIGAGDTLDLEVVVSNDLTVAQSGTVTLDMPEGFSADPAEQPFDDLAGGESTSVTFTVTNEDDTLPTANEGGDDGDYDVTVATEVNGDTMTEVFGLNLVPVTTIPYAETAPELDGVIDPDEYTGEALDLSRVWEGDEPDGPEDASGTGYMMWDDDGIYFGVEVVDDVFGAVVEPEDARRHWRTDSVEIAIDPLGTAENTASTFKVGVFPTTTDGEPGASRDADNFQGPIEETAPGFEMASTVTDPYEGYTLEVFVPFTALPADVDPENAAVNIFIYDSDTDDLTGQSRLGWSTYGGVQGDPYRWGQTTFEGMEADEVSDAVAEPTIPTDVALSILSPQSIMQSAHDGVGLAGLPQVPHGEGLMLGEINGDTVELTSETPGAYNAFVVVGDDVLHAEDGQVGPDQPASLSIPADASGGWLLVSLDSEDGSKDALAEELP